ncbi:hypothetical protein VK792_07865 [Mesobacterium sp. TK19101]|uniref:Uncharacterized protein n=1 Tax=Mesobacterium hydrothermale TaxID=3111907 RepID=A0ABU6HFS4_9RHOB|nr:hypothetical protein [Mesobacterium sp. TK19101]MEC3861196.1 hypothetical protein [Mesobacterium sp. TK19101]
MTRKSLKINGGEYRNRTGVHGFAIRPAIQRKQGAAVSKEAPTNRELSAKVSNAELTGANENPGATAIATGAKDVVEGVNSCREYIAAFPILAMHWGALV